MSTTTHKLEVAEDTGTGRQKLRTREVEIPDGGEGRKVGMVGVLEETFDHEDFTDGGGASATIQFTGALPKGALVLATRIKVPEGFAGDTSATAQVGDGSDADRYMTGTPDVFSTVADGVEAGVPSGALLLTSENKPTITVTTNADWGSVTAGKLTVAIYYIEA